MQLIIRAVMSLFAVMVLTSLAAGATEAQVSVTTLDGAQLNGFVTDWNVEGLTISVEGQPTKIAAESLLAIRSLSSANNLETALAQLHLVDGTVLPITDFTVTDHQATVITPLAEQPLTFATDDIHLLQVDPLDQRVVKLWSDLAEKRLDGDVLIVHKKQKTTLDYLTGVLGDVTSEQIVFNWDGDEIPVKRSKVAALIYFHARQPEQSAAICWLKTQDGAQFPLASLALDEENLQLITLGGLKLNLPLASLQEADYSLGKITYLSDLQPVRQKWTPRIEFPDSAKFIAAYGTPRKDQSFSGSTLTLRWPPIAEQPSRSKSIIEMYQKGLALRSRTVLQYRLPPQMQRFVAIAGIDPATADQGNVHLVISAGDQILWQGEIDGAGPPVEIEFELNGARQLRILVDYGANLDFGDRLHLVEARVTK